MIKSLTLTIDAPAIIGMAGGMERLQENLW